MAARVEEEQGLITEINVTPMVDIVLVLLIIFMVTATYITRYAMEVNLPKGTGGKVVPTTVLNVAVGKSGAMMVNGRRATLDDLEEMVPALLEKNPELQAVVDGDREASYGRVMEVIYILRKLGVKRFAASIEPEGPASGGDRLP